MSIRLKLAIMFLAIASLPLLLVSALTFTNYEKSLEARRLLQLQDITAYKAERIEAFFASLKNDIETAQGYYNIKENLPVLTRFAEDPNNPDFFAAKKMLDAQLQRMQSVLGLSDIMLVNPKGKVVYSSNPEHYPKDFSKPLLDPEQKAFEEGKSKIYFSDIFFSKTGIDKTIMLVTGPAHDFNDAFIGVIALEVDAKSLYRIIENVTGLGKTGEVLLGKKIGNQVLYLNPLRHDPNAALIRKVDIGSEIGRPIQEAIQGKTGTGQYLDYRGKKVIAAWRHIPFIDWGMVAKIDTKEAFADVTNLRNLAAVILVIVIVLSSIMAFSIAHSISEPIKRLSEGAAIIGGGNLDYKIGTNQKDEIGQLSRSFDKMTLDLKQTTASRDELNKEIIERKKAEEELRQSEIKYRTVADNTYDWEFWLDPESRFLYCSPSCQRITGHKPEEFLADPGLRTRLIHPDDRPLFEKHVNEIEHKQKGIAEGEWRLVRPDGTCCWVAHACQPVYDDSGRFIGTRGSNRDITARKQMEDTLASQRKEQQVILESVPAMIFYKDKENRFIRTNKAFEEAMRLPKEKLEGKSLFDIYSKEQAEAYWMDDKEVIASGKAKYGIIETMPTPEGIKCLLTDKVPYFDESGNVLGVIGFAVDITERKKAEEALRESEQHLSAVFRASPTGIFVTRMTDGLFIEANEAYMQIIGYSADEVIGHTSSELNIWVNPEDRERIVGILREQGRIENSEVKFRRKNGEILDLLYSALPLERGGEHCILGTLTDITSRKRAEKAVRRAATRFEILSDTASKLLESKNPQQIVNSLCNRVMEYLDCHIFVNYLVDEQAHRLHLNTTGGLPEKMVRDIEWLDFGQAICGRVAKEGKRIVAENIQESCDARADLVRSVGIKAYACHPIMTQGKVIGTLSFGTKSRKTFSDDDLATMKTVTDQVATAMERMRTEEELRKSRDELEIRVKERTADLDETVAELQHQVEQRIRAEEAFRSASLYTRGLIEASLDPLVTISPEGKITDVNKATEAVTGISRERLIGSDFSNYFTEPQKANEGYKKVIAEGKVIDYPLTIRHTSGRITDVMYNATVYKNEAGQIQGVFAAARDVTVQKQASQYARSLLESSLDPLVTISAAGKITDVNEATIKVTGVARQQLIGTDFSDYFTEPQKAREGYQQVFARGFVTDYPLTIRHKDGRLTDVLYNANVYKDTHGNVIGVFAAARDITEKKAAEAELEKYRLHLEDLVKQRTEELARSNNDLEQFAYVASHDLQEPLRAVSGFVELLRRNLQKSLDEKTREYMNFSIDGAKRMQSLINGLLEYSRIGTQGKKPQKVNSKEAIDEALARLHAAIQESGAKITADNLPTVYFDEVQLSQLFQNLIGNAIKFRSDQAPRININAVRKDSEWQFAVTDNGIGIEPQYAERIFMIFQRLHNRGKYPGTGIGLSICKKIVERHNGKIWVESKPGSGSTFYFTVPDIEET